VKFLFDDYPGDSQQIVIRFGSYAYDKTWLQMGFDPRGGLSFNENFDKSRTFLENPSWEFDNTTTSFDTYESSSRFLNVIYLLGVRRRGSGIVLRLILPITLLCFLGGLTFWADYGERVNTTITLLLAVSALYIVILGNIPLVGYLTSMDEYIFWVSCSSLRCYLIVPLLPFPYAVPMIDVLVARVRSYIATSLRLIARKD
jgi:hypothetical protein